MSALYKECEKVKELISDYVDESLASHEHAFVTNHIAICDGCRQAVDETSRLVAQLSDLSGNRVGFDLWPAVAERITEQKHRRSFLHRTLSLTNWKTLAIPAAAIAAGLIFIAVKPVGPLHTGTKATVTNQQQVSAEYKAYIQAYSRFRSAQPLTDRGAIGAAEQLNRHEAVPN